MTMRRVLAECGVEPACLSNAGQGDVNLCGDEIVVEPIAAQDWATLAKLFDRRDYQQGCSYSQLAALRVGAISQTVAIYRRGSIVGLASARIKKWPGLPFRFVYVHGGPIYDSGQDESINEFATCAYALKKHFANKFGTLLRIVPASNGGAHAESQSSTLLLLGFKRHPRDAYRSLIKRIDLEDGPLRLSLDPKWRRDLSRSESQAIVVKRSFDVKDIQVFQQIHDELKLKKGFSVNHDVHFFSEVQNHASQVEKCVIHIAWSGSEAVAGHVGHLMGKTAVYLFGAATARGREARASFLLQWEFMRYAREQGVEWYDLGGIDPESNPDVFRFKKRLNADEMRWAGYFDFSADSLTSSLFYSLEMLFKKATPILKLFERPLRSPSRNGRLATERLDRD